MHNIEAHILNGFESAEAAGQAAHREDNLASLVLWLARRRRLGHEADSNGVGSIRGRKLRFFCREQAWPAASDEFLPLPEKPFRRCQNDDDDRKSENDTLYARETRAELRL